MTPRRKKAGQDLPPGKPSGASPAPQAPAGPIRDDPGAPGAAILVDLKAVPGSSRDQVAGLLGARLKVRVAAPPEDGKANAAICKLLAGLLGVAARQVEVVSGHSRPEKTVRITGVGASNARAKLLS